MRLSEIDPSEIQSIPVGPSPSDQPSKLRLSHLSSHEVSYVAPDALQSQYGSLPQQALAGAEGAARGVSLGTSDYLEQKVLGVSPESIQGRMEANPVTSFVGNMIGGGALLYGTGGLGAGVLPMAAEGAIFGAGNAISDAALGDPDLNAQKVLAHIGLGAAIGGGLGVLSKGIGLASALIKPGTQAAEELAPAVEAPVVDVAMGKVPRSLREMQEAVEQAKKYGGQENIYELPQKSEALDAHSRIGSEMQLPVNEMQLDSLSSQDARNKFKTMVEVPGKNGEILRNYQGAQKKDLIRILDKTMEDVAPGYTPTSDAQEAGERAAKSFTDVIESTRKELGPAFEKIKATPLADMDHLPGVIDSLTEANPKIANMFDTQGDVIAINPYKTSMGLDHATYRAIKGAVESLEENPKDFSQLFDIRKGLSQHVDVTKLGDAAKEITQAKAAMMEYIQKAVQSHEPDLAVRETFRKWAINEQNAQMIERKFGAEIGSGNFRSLARGKPDEAILRKIFSDSETVAAVKQILPINKFNELLSDHLEILRKEVTDKGVFSSNKFNSALKRGQYALNEAFSNNPEAYQKMKDSLTLLRIFADDVPHNPSGTTKTLLQALSSQALHPTDWNHLFSYAKEKMAEMGQAALINQKLAQTSDQATKLNTIQGLLERVTHQIQSGAKSLFQSDAGRGASISGSLQMGEGEFKKLKKKLGDFTADPKRMMDHVAENTNSIYQAAPNITQGISTSLYTGVGFLNSKMPQPPEAAQMPLSPPWEPSRAQMTQFNHYYQAVNNPVGAFKQVKDGSLTNQTMEALQAVHPKLLQEMRVQTIEQMKNLEKIKKLPYSQKLSLAKFLGTPLDENMTGPAILNNQIAMNAPNQSQQTSQAGKMTVGGMKQLGLAGRTETRTYRDQEPL